MSQQAVESILGRLLTDAVFRDRFFAEPTGSCRDHAFDLTPGELAVVVKIDIDALRTMAARLDPRIVRARSLSLASTRTLQSSRQE